MVHPIPGTDERAYTRGAMMEIGGQARIKRLDDARTCWTSDC